MRVLHVTETSFGGVGSYLDDVCVFQTHVFGPGNVMIAAPRGSAPMLPSIDRSQIVELEGVGRSPPGLIRLGRTISRLTAEFDPDVIHLHSTFAGFAGRIALKLRPHRARIVYCPHGWAFGMKIGAASKLAYAACEKLLTTWSDMIVLNSESERLLARKFGISADKLQVVRNGVPPAPAAPRRAEPDRLDLVFVGRHDRQKGLDILLDELDRPDCAHLHLHVIGGNVISRESPLLSRTLRNITFHGWMARDEIAALLRTMDAMVIPSRWEAAPLVALEAMSCGLPVIASKAGGLPEAVRHGIDGLIVDIDEPGELGRTLASLTREQLKRFAPSARTRYEAEFTAERMNRELAATYATLLSSAPREQTRLLESAPEAQAE